MAVQCLHCRRAFHSTRGLFGQSAEALRDAHALLCDENPANRCFCGKVFQSSAARDNHAALCCANPANKFQCRHCSREYLTSFNVLGFKSSDGRALRDAHEVGCKNNPANTCFCGQLFPSPDARNSHAVTCEMNPANRHECGFCKSSFVTQFTVFGFCSTDGRSLRDAHQLCCEKNPRNICFCGRLFSNADARDRHAATCELNPANRFECRHCMSTFVTRYGMMGMVAASGKSLRDAHELGCGKNPANRCFCGQLFLSPDRRDAHAAVCEMNPKNRFTCPHCGITCVTTYGLFTKCGSEKLASHLQACPKNPANFACEHCGLTFATAQGIRRHLCSDARSLCKAHAASCSRNPRNRFSCRKCDRCFSNGRSWGRRRDGRLLRDLHEESCDFIPCSFKVAEAGYQDWVLLAPEGEPDTALQDGILLDSPTESDASDFEDDDRGAQREADARAAEVGPLHRKGSFDKDLVQDRDSGVQRVAAEAGVEPALCHGSFGKNLVQESIDGAGMAPSAAFFDAASELGSEDDEEEFEEEKDDDVRDGGEVEVLSVSDEEVDFSLA